MHSANERRWIIETVELAFAGVAHMLHPRSTPRTQETELHADRLAREPPTIGETISRAVDVVESDQAGAALLIGEATLALPWAASALSIVGPHDRTSFCVTGQYGRALNRASGSLYWAEKRTVGPLDAETRRNLASTVGSKLRRFSPAELLALLGFPRTFRLPPKIALRQQFKMVGNSINVHVVAAMLSELLELGGRTSLPDASPNAS